MYTKAWKKYFFETKIIVANRALLQRKIKLVNKHETNCSTLYNNKKNFCESERMRECERDV